MAPGDSIGHYRIVRPLGQGGMGEVYLAEDTRLRREVAIKVLPEALRNDEERLRLFRREAEAAARLKHPNIATIHALEDLDDTRCIVMEYVEGETLASRVGPRGMKLDELFSIFIPLADALAHAHAHGRIHRDLKPSNIMITPDGAPKILDFGLARITRADAPREAGQGSEAPTTPGNEMPSLTRQGQLVGTPAYMSPEQAQGEPTDERTDLFSLGVVMYEAVVGNRPFDGKTLEVVLGRILDSHPPAVATLRPETPYLLDWVISKSLEKDRASRMQTARELHRDLTHVEREMREGAALVKATGSAAIPNVSMKKTPAIFAALLALAAGAGAAWWLHPGPPTPAVRKFTMEREGLLGAPAISPDGTKIAYIRNDRLWIQDLSQAMPREVPETDGAYAPFWSPRSDQIGYSARVAPRGLWKVPAAGGPTIRISDLPEGIVTGLTWGADDTIVAGIAVLPDWEPALWAVSAGGGSFERRLEPDPSRGEWGLSSPRFLADGTILSFQVWDASDAAATQEYFRTRWGSASGIPPAAGLRPPPSTVHVSTSDGKRQPLMLPENIEEIVALSPSHHLIYRTADATLWAVPFSTSALAITGEPFAIAQEVGPASSATDGTLIYRSLDANDHRMAWIDRTGRVGSGFGPSTPGDLAQLSLSPDGQSIALAAWADGNQDIWIHDVDRGATTRFTFDSAPDRNPVWSPAGDTLAFWSARSLQPGSNGNRTLIRALGGSEPARLLTDWPSVNWPESWSRDGRFIVLSMANEGSLDAGYVDVTQESLEAIPFVTTPFRDRGGSISPDGRAFLYVSNESGRDEVYVQTFPNGGDKWQVSVDGGDTSRFSPRGDEILFQRRDEDGTAALMVAPVVARQPLRTGSPQKLFDLPESDSFHYDVSPDAQRFLVLRREAGAAAPTITVVQNWYQEFASSE